MKAVFSDMKQIRT